MRIGRVIGNIWATRKEERLSGFKLLLVQPINIVTMDNYKVPIVAVDTIGAGVGETVIYVGGSSARRSGDSTDSQAPVDATVVGIVDDKEIDTSLI